MSPLEFIGVLLAGCFAYIIANAIRIDSAKEDREPGLAHPDEDDREGA